jgi:hypothetical protein
MMPTAGVQHYVFGQALRHLRAAQAWLKRADEANGFTAEGRAIAALIQADLAPASEKLATLKAMYEAASNAAEVERLAAIMEATVALYADPPANAPN